MNNGFNVKSVYPPINPGVRVWKGVEPEKHIVNMPKKPIYNFGILPSPFIQNCGPRLPYVVPVGGERIEPFGFGNSDMFMKLIVFAVICYLIYHFVVKSQNI